MVPIFFIDSATGYSGKFDSTGNRCTTFSAGIYKRKSPKMGLFTWDYQMDGYRGTAIFGFEFPSIIFLRMAFALENWDLLVLSVMPSCTAISLCEYPSIAYKLKTVR